LLTRERCIAEYRRIVEQDPERGKTSRDQSYAESKIAITLPSSPPGARPESKLAIDVKMACALFEHPETPKKYNLSQQKND
jgi:hypothetical protein